MKRILLVIAAFVAAIVLFNVVITVANNRVAADLERLLLECPLPRDTQIIDSVSVAGKMGGNGNGMQWYGSLLVESGLSEDELYDHYVSCFTLYDYFAARFTLDGDHWLWVSPQTTPYVFEYRDIRFDNFDEGVPLWQITLMKNSVAGAEDSIWESLLNCDIRGH